MPPREREQQSRDVRPVVRLGVGVVEDDVLLVAGESSPEREPHVASLAALAGESHVAEERLDARPVTPQEGEREVVAGEPLGERVDPRGGRPERNDDAARGDPFERREDAFGGETGVLALGHRHDHRGAVDRGVGRRPAEVVERRDTLLDVLHHPCHGFGRQKSRERGSTARSRRGAEREPT